MPGAGHIVHMPGAHLLPGRPLPGLARAPTSPRSRPTRPTSRRPTARGYYPLRLLSAQHPLRDGLGADGRRRRAHARGRPSGSTARSRTRSPAAIGWVQAIMPAPYFAHAQFSEPDDDPGPRRIRATSFPFVKAMWHYARGVAAGRARAISRPPRSEAARIAELDQTRGLLDADRPGRAGAGRAADRPPRARGPDRPGRGRLEHGDPRSSRARCRSRTRCPTWSRPTGTTRCASRSARRCCRPAGPRRRRQTFQAALIDAPNNGWALWGLMEAQKAAGDQAAAERTAPAVREGLGGRRQPARPRPSLNLADREDADGPARCGAVSS